MNRKLPSKKLVCQQGSLALESYDSSEIEMADDQVLIDVRSVGLCRTDLYAIDGGIKGLTRFVPGHEFSGVVAKVSDRAKTTAGLAVGQRVVVNPVLACGQCEDCRRGEVHWCAETRFLGVDQDGALQDSIAVSANQVFPISDSLNFDEAAFAEPVAATLGIFNANVLDPAEAKSQRGLLVGRGRIFKLAQRVMEAKGFSNVLAYDPFSDSKAPEGEFDFVVETELSSTVLRALIRFVKPRGTIILKSRSNLPFGLIPREWIPKQPVIQLVNYGRFSEAVVLLESRSVLVEDLIGPRFSLDDFELAFDAARRSDAQKTFIQVGS